MEKKVVRVLETTLSSVLLIGSGCQFNTDIESHLDAEPTLAEDGRPLASDRPAAHVEGFSLDIAISGTEIELSWASQGPGVTYTVWRSDDPGFMPGDSGSITLVESGASTSVNDPVAGNGVHYYYRVVASDDGGDTVSTTVGKYAHVLYAGYNKIPQPLDTGLTDAAAFAALHPGSVAAYLLDATSQSFRYWPGQDPFPYGPGEVPIVHAGGGVWGQIYEDVGHVPAPGSIALALHPGNNLVTVPLDHGDTTAQEIFAGVPDVWRVGYWDPATQSRTWYYGDGQGDFSVEAGRDVYVEVWAPSSWPPMPLPPAVDPTLDPLEDLGPVQLVSGGHIFTEGAAWHAGEQALYFVDLELDTVHRLEPGVGVTQVRGPSGRFTNGMTFDAAGNRLECQHATQSVVRVLAGGAVEQQIAHTYQGTVLNSPNDLVLGGDGTLYFGDAAIGAFPNFGNVQDMPLGFRGVYRVDTAGGLHLVDDIFNEPTGIALSPDGSTLYVSDWADGLLHAYPIAADGSTGAGAVLSDEVPSADGMCVDAEGNLYVSTADGLRVMQPDGTVWGTILVPEEPANCAFGGEDLSTLYITARHGVYSVDVTIPGAPPLGA